MILISGCSKITHKGEEDSYASLEAEAEAETKTENDMDEKNNNFDSSPNAKDYGFPIPEEVGTIINYKKNGLSTIIVNKQTMIDYYAELEKNNWKALRTKTSDAPVSFYFNGSDGLIITESLLDDKESREVVINYYEGKDNTSNRNEYDDKIKQFLSDDYIYAISEYDISEATKELGLRGFYAYTNKMEPTKNIIDKYGEILPINYDQLLVCDIDSDGEKEFITRFGYGFGRYVITLSVWKYNHDNRKLELTYQTQYEQLDSVDMFIKEKDNNVEVISGYWEKEDIILQESYGKLHIEDEMLVIDKKDIPFKLLGGAEAVTTAVE